MERSSAGDTIPSHCAVIRVRVAELKQLFNAMDPSPFRDKRLATMRSGAFGTRTCGITRNAPRACTSTGWATRGRT